jgi:hypothetical protein
MTIMEITTAAVAANAKGRHRWVTFPDPLLGTEHPRGIERVRLSKLVRLLGPRKASDVRWTLDDERGTLRVSWANLVGGKGAITFRLARVPQMGGHSWKPLESFRWWSEKPHT